MGYNTVLPGVRAPEGPRSRYRRGMNPIEAIRSISVRQARQLTSAEKIETRCPIASASFIVMLHRGLVAVPPR